MEIKYIGKCLLLGLKPRFTSSDGTSNPSDSKGDRSFQTSSEDAERILVVGDLHLGWEESMNRSGVLVSRQMFDEIIKDFDEIFEEVGNVDKIVLLGDVKHNFSGNFRQEWDDLNKLFEYLSEKCSEILVCKGNHDNYLMNVSGRFEKIRVEEYFILGGFAFMHGNKDFPEIYSKEIRNWVIGHLHPAIVLREENGVKEEKYKCFLEGEYKRKKVFVLPSFFPVIEGRDCLLGVGGEDKMWMPWDFKIKDWKVRVVGDGLDVLDFGRLKNIN